MRVIGFSKRWSKLDNQEFTTFRFPRKDRDWYVGEVVQVVLHPRSPKREPLGIARIVNKKLRALKVCASFGCLSVKEASNPPLVTDAEALADGFKDLTDMILWMQESHGPDTGPILNKLTLVWEQQ